MDKATYQQLDRIEVKIDALIEKIAPEIFKEEEKPNAKKYTKPENSQNR